MAMQMGLHQDPDYLGDTNAEQKEIRRRLWYTILEMNIQAALDSGMVPMITENDYNTLPPSSIEDVNIDPEGSEGVKETTLTSYPKSLQYILARSISFRLKATKVINSLEEEPSYESVLQLGHELASVCREAAVSTSSGPSELGSSPGGQFANSFCSHLLNRFLLCLHFKYAMQATQNPLYSHSHRVCLEVALALISLLDDDIYSRLLINGSGMFRDIITRGALMVFLELNTLHQSGISELAKRRNRARQEPLLIDAHRLVRYAKERMCHGETNVKGYLFLKLATTQTEALINEVPVEQAMKKAASESLDECEFILGNISTCSDVIIEPGDFEAWRPGGSTHIPIDLNSGLDSLDDDNFTFDLSDPSTFQNWTDLSIY
ncbi:transcriptional regulator family: Fungal Specific TF [Penicillium atrosanguineum]|uniref:Transcriptional regulator family: Fungal Specific TF n=1 Tax=Penicillium atrosanguineum TaxID=1132637 RepID=A0A9W9U2V6_9EURO|nr:transcriptional regulator family: Fungal Specific TF [Penicillium atrosanguineum]KAJ5310958.1 transcriptional regulator family: Fungal Specific TF [Penicillium atrosanguineum]